MSVAVLYADPARGPYVPLVGAESVYGVERDARRYYGPGPVVAHPPCGPWGSLASFCYLQDPGAAPLAVVQVRKLGGVLEHPRGSRLWELMRLPRPDITPPLPLGQREWALQVDQVDWGHPARKRTWLLFVGLHPSDLPPLPRRRAPTHVVSSSCDPASRGYSPRPKLWGSETHLTPPAFARWLVECARRCARPALDPLDTTLTRRAVSEENRGVPE